MLKTWREWWCYRCDDYEANDHSSRVCVYISTSVTQLDSFKETSGQFPVKFVATKTKYFWQKVWTSLAAVVLTKSGIGNQKSECFFMPKSYQNISTALSQHKIENSKKHRVANVRKFRVSTCPWFAETNIYSGLAGGCILIMAELSCRGEQYDLLNSPLII